MPIRIGNRCAFVLMHWFFVHKLAKGYGAIKLKGRLQHLGVCNNYIVFHPTKTSLGQALAFFCICLPLFAINTITMNHDHKVQQCDALFFSTS